MFILNMYNPGYKCYNNTIETHTANVALLAFTEHTSLIFSYILLKEIDCKIPKALKELRIHLFYSGITATNGQSLKY